MFAGKCSVLCPLPMLLGHKSYCIQNRSLHVARQNAAQIIPAYSNLLTHKIQAIADSTSCFGDLLCTVHFRSNRIWNLLASIQVCHIIQLKYICSKKRTPHLKPSFEVHSVFCQQVWSRCAPNSPMNFKCECHL